ncbi:zinc finger protein OZF-like [Thalassophryne amazonica]|uniref:zinc finger protein OZF-like n=1 Tax=Thalassophryne amazonica TaxID=390379 RepID=UPI001470B577|nr:zinc finger protein OZF-like [Thalassophryne amazonica]
MSKVLILRALLKQRLPADDEEEIFELFERTIAEHEEEIRGLKEENETLRKLLHPVFNADDKTDVQQQLLVREAEVPAKQQAWTSSLDQEDPELHHFKKKEEEPWTCAKREHRLLLEVNSSMHAVNDVKPESSNYDQLKSEENREAEPLASSSGEQIKTKNDGEEWAGSKPDGRMVQDNYLHQCSNAMISQSNGPECDISGVDFKETEEAKSCLNSLENKIIPVSGNRCNAGAGGSECGETFNRNRKLKMHMRAHTGKKRFKCSECGKIFSQKSNLNRHMAIHMGKTSFRCPECGKAFNRNGNLKTHMMLHTGKKTFKCSKCGNVFSQKCNLKRHMVIHTRKTSFECSECGKTFNTKAHMQTHILIHTGEKPFRCSECGKTFNTKCSQKTHMLTHTGERPFHCPECGRTFNQNSLLKMHMLIHTGEKTFSCSECGKTFNRNDYLKTHMMFHKGYKPYYCSECGKAFALKTHLKTHMTTHKVGKTT